MKSAYERAMERFGDGEPVVSLSDEQKAELAKIEEKFKAKIAERQMFLDDLIKKANDTASYFEIPELEEQKRREIAKLEKTRDEQKEEVRAQK